MQVSHHLELSAHFLTDLQLTNALREIYDVENVSFSLAEHINYEKRKWRHDSYDSSEESDTSGGLEHLDGSDTSDDHEPSRNKPSGLTTTEREQCTEKYKFAAEMALLTQQNVQPSAEAVLNLYKRYEVERLMLYKWWSDRFYQVEKLEEMCLAAWLQDDTGRVKQVKLWKDG